MGEPPVFKDKICAVFEQISHRGWEEWGLQGQGAAMGKHSFAAFRSVGVHLWESMFPNPWVFLVKSLPEKGRR